jgi:putative endonuclease
VRTYYVYVMASRSRVLYTGVTNDLTGRVERHKTGAPAGFTSWYNVTRLVYFETFTNLRDAIRREKQLKGWTRAKKSHLIERANPGWADLARDWFQSTTSPSRPAP